MFYISYIDICHRVCPSKKFFHKNYIFIRERRAVRKIYYVENDVCIEIIRENKKHKFVRERIRQP